ncbi:hypothetical protein BGZ97_010108, partial [Linnemannia gamsii]
DMLYWAQKRNLFSSKEEYVAHARQNTLFAISQSLNGMGQSLRHFPTLPQDISNSIIQYNDELQESNYNKPTKNELTATYYTNHSSLNK